MNTAPPRTVLLAWELGGGFGHARNLTRVAAALAGDGLRPVLAVRDAARAWPVLRDLPWPVVPAPHAPAAGPGPFPVASFAGVLGYNGYGSADTLAPLIGCWDGLLAALDPALLVADFAPSAVLAAAGRVPVVDVGNGYSQPPTHPPAFPTLPGDARPQSAEAGLLANVAAVTGRAFPSLPAAFAAHACVTSLPEIDPYRDHRPVPQAGPLDPHPPLTPRPDGAGVFLYLDAASEAGRTVPGLLAAAGVTGEAYIRGGARPVGFACHDRPPPLDEALARCGAVVHHGGASTAMSALAAGRPQLLLPGSLEQMLTADALHKLGVAHYLAGRWPAADAAEAVRQLLHEPAFARRAAESAEAVRAAYPAGGLPAVLARCRAALAG